MDWIDTLRLKRLEKRLSQTAVAKKIGVGLQSVYKWETRRDTPTMPLFMAWANSLGYTFQMVEQEE